MALPTALLAKGGIGVVAVAAPISAYFITDAINKNKLREENKKLNEKITALGIDSGCHFKDTAKSADCKLDADKLKAIKFEGKSGDTATGDKKIDLVIEKGYKNFKKSETPNDLYFPEGLRFIFKNTNKGTNDDIEVGSNGNKITFKAETNYDYKIKTDAGTTKLEKAWDLTTLNGIAGVICCTATSGDSSDITQCDLTTGKVNVWKGKGDYITEATVAESSKIKVAKDQKDHKNGFKFTVESDISLTQADENKKSGTVDKLIKDNKSYEIDVKNIGGTKTWFLVERTSSASSVPQESQ